MIRCKYCLHLYPSCRTMPLVANGLPSNSVSVRRISKWQSGVVVPFTSVGHVRFIKLGSVFTHGETIVCVCKQIALVFSYLS